MKLRLFITIASVLLLTVGCSQETTPPEIPDTPKKEEPGEKEHPDDPEKPDEPTGGNEWEIVNIPHYLLAFEQPNAFNAYAGNKSFIEVGYYRMNLMDYCNFYHEQDAENYPEKAAAYKALCERYNDTSFNQERKINSIVATECCCYLIHNIVSIDVVSATDYDSEHPAGTSLNDLCDLVSWSPKDYISSGYTDTYDWNDWPEYFPARTEFDVGNPDASKPFCKPLTQCTPEDMVLMGEGTSNIFMLRFSHLPDAGHSLQQFTVTLTDEQGKTYKAVTEVAEWK